ncbi:MAG: hypothetical protein R3E39_09860 [Anaerolineae bacterium]
MPRLAVATLVTLLVLSGSLTVHAQNQTDRRLWGIWKEVTLNGTPSADDYEYDSVLVLTPMGDWFEQLLEGSPSGTYTADGQQLTLNGVSTYIETTSFSQTVRYEFVGDHLRTYDLDVQGYVQDFEKLESFTTLDFVHCPSSIPSKMIIGANAAKTNRDDTPTPLHARPTQSSEVLGAVPDAFGFLVVGEPVCAEGYTWWPVSSGFSKTADGSEQLAWVAEGADDNSIAPAFALDTSLLPATQAGSVDTLLKEAALQLSAAYYAPGEYQLVEALARAVSSGNLVDDLAKTQVILKDASVLVLSGKLPLPDANDFIKPDDPLELVCFNAPLASFGDTTKIDDGSGVTVACLVWDTTTLSVARGPIVGGVYFMAQHLLDPAWIIERFAEPVNDWADTYPLDRFARALNPT